MLKSRMKLAKTLAATLLLTASLGSTAYAGQWQLNEYGWHYQQDDGTYADWGWQWIDGKCYHFSGAYKNQDNPVCDTDFVVDRHYPVDASGAWTYNGTAVTQGSELAQKLTSDYFSGTYISYVEDARYENGYNSYRIDIRMDSDGITPAVYHINSYVADYSQDWTDLGEFGGLASQRLDEKGNPVLEFKEYDTDRTCALTKEGDILLYNGIAFQKQPATVN